MPEDLSQVFHRLSDPIPYIARDKVRIAPDVIYLREDRIEGLELRVLPTEGRKDHIEREEAGDDIAPLHFKFEGACKEQFNLSFVIARLGLNNHHKPGKLQHLFLRE